MANVNKDALVSAVVGKLDLSKKDVEAVIETIVDEITNSLRKGDKVTITGFGTFRVSNRAAREGINPQTKAKITIPAMTVPKFTAGKTLKCIVTAALLTRSEPGGKGRCVPLMTLNGLW